MKRTFNLLFILLLGCSNINSLSSEPLSTSLELETYTITWKNYDGTILEIDTNIERNTLPTYDGDIPTRTGEEGFIYTFDYWSPDVIEVIEDVTYIAEYSLFIEEEAGTQGLIYELLEDNTYSVNARNIKNEENVVIPSEYNRLPVSKVEEKESILLVDSNYDIKSVTLSNSIKTIGVAAFFEYFQLESINIPNSVTSIGEAAFWYCKFETIAIPNSVTSIGEFAFFSCVRLETILIPNSIIRLEQAVFIYSGLKSIVIPKNVTYIGWNTFAHCKNLEVVILPESLTYIGDAAFNDCPSLKNIIITSNVEYIGGDAFYQCLNLEYIIIPLSVINIGNWTFQYCNNLTIYSEHLSKPNGWSSVWNYDNRPIYWGGEWHLDENNIPTPN
ncbi:MAG: leucine-rich repeat domain-containing protein [Bacillales bacterium]|jgi:hypothetical protein|nr:leucine-rich repeat domain-containing protein [Bacillales bacterium]